jgi:DNA-directed RNA polymerase specialized sigma24 family protein
MLTDAELVASARAGDRGAVSAIYDEYADRLYDLCTAVMREPEDAFDAMVDTFVLAALELYRLRRPEKLEPWLFALARQQLLGRDIPIGVDEHAEFDGATGKAASDGAGAIVWEATSWFPGKDRILLDLHTRQPLDHQALAETLGVSPPHAAALVRDLDERMDRLLSALLVARLSRPGCAHMKKLIASEDEEHPDRWLRHVALHVDVCRKCLLWREEQPNPLQLIAEVPAEPAPPEVRDEVLDRVDLLWSALGPPEWTAAVLGQAPPAATPAPATDEPADATPPPHGPDETEPLAIAPADEPTEPDLELRPQDVAAAADAAAAAEGSEPAYAEAEYDAYDEVESLVPPPPRSSRPPRPRRRRRRRPRPSPSGPTRARRSSTTSPPFSAASARGRRPAPRSRAWSIPATTSPRWSSCSRTQPGPRRAAG